MNIKGTIRLFLFFCLSMYTADSKAQRDSSFQYLKSIKGDFSSFNVDNLDNIYLLSGSGQLRKLNSNGDSVAGFNDVKRFGNPSSLDVTNPLKILLYYKNFSTVMIIDRNLSIRNIIDFRKQNIFLVKTIAASYDNNIWIFDEADYKLKKIDEQGNQLMETTGWRILFDSVPSPVQLIDRDNYVYLYDTEKGFYIFDYYGGFKSRLPFLNWKNVEVSGKILYGFDNNILFSYQLNSLTLKEYKLPPFLGEYKAIRAMNGRLYLLKNEGVDIYLLK